MSRWLLVLGAMAGLTAGCSAPPEPEQRYLSKEADERIRQVCEPFDDEGGCAVVPVPLFREMLQQLRSPGRSV